MNRNWYSLFTNPYDDTEAIKSNLANLLRETKYITFSLATDWSDIYDGNKYKYYMT